MPLFNILMIETTLPHVVGRGNSHRLAKYRSQVAHPRRLI
jgi:hypothetical protein